jgi:ATP-binding cassette, subfamily C, bacterial
MAARDVSAKAAEDAEASRDLVSEISEPTPLPATSLSEMGRGYWSIIGPERWLAVAAVAIAWISGVLEGTALMMLIPLLQRTPLGGATRGPFTSLLESLGFHGRGLVWAGVAGFGLMTLAAAVGTFTGNALIAVVRARTEVRLRKDLTERLLGMEWSAFLMTRLGDMASSLLMESGQVGGGIQQILTSVAALLQAAFFVGLAFFLSAKLTGLIVGLAFVTVFGLRPAGRRVEAQTRALAAATQEIGRRISDVIGNLKFFRSTGGRARGQTLFWASYDEYANRWLWTQLAPFAVRLGYEMVALLFVVALIAVSLGGASTLSGTTIVFLAIFLRLSPRMRDIQGGTVMARVYYPWVDKWKQRVAAAAAHPAAPSGTGTPTFDGRLAAEGVSFAFPGLAEMVVDTVSWELGRGETIAFVGESGAGKTTMLDLVSGLLVPTRGRISLDGVSLTELDHELWQSHIGLVLDQSPLFHATVRENIVADERIDDDLVWDCLAAAHAEGFIRELPHGLDTVIGERGGRLSGGQRQRLGLARALYRRPWLLILDEATSMLDSASESVVLEALRDLHGQLSMIMVAHRLVTVRMANRIYVLDRGRIVQSGSWEELLADSFGQFAQMAAKQGFFAESAGTLRQAEGT